MTVAKMSLTQETQLLWTEEPGSKESFDRVPFSFRHSLAGHPLFELARLTRLANLLKRGLYNVAFDSGDISVEQRWNVRKPSQYTLEQALERIQSAGAWVILKHCELDPEYRALMESIMSAAERVINRPLWSKTKNLEAQIMITSPNRITPYHLDNECNLLFQITGGKDIFVFDQTNREVLTEAELEHFWVGDWNAGEYKARCQDSARAFRLTPGGAVHIPVNAPHWVKNDANVSVSLSVNFEWKDERVPNVYRANYYLRRIGIRPRPPGQSRLSDSTKNIVVGATFVPARSSARSTLHFFRRLRKRWHSKQQDLKTTS